MNTQTVCDYCGQEFSYALFPSMKPRKFCSRSCSVAWHNTHNPKRKPTHSCKHCGQLIHGRTSNVYCSPKCRRAAHDERPNPQTPYDSIRNFRKRMKEELVALLGGACVVCGYSRCIAALDFHHLDPNKKDFNVGAQIRSKARAVEEARKCVLLCANCHRELHAGMIKIAISGIEPEVSTLSEWRFSVKLDG